MKALTPRIPRRTAAFKRKSFNVYESPQTLFDRSFRVQILYGTPCPTLQCRKNRSNYSQPEHTTDLVAQEIERLQSLSCSLAHPARSPYHLLDNWSTPDLASLPTIARAAYQYRTLPHYPLLCALHLSLDPLPCKQRSPSIPFAARTRKDRHLREVDLHPILLRVCFQQRHRPPHRCPQAARRQVNQERGPARHQVQSNSQLPIQMSHLLRHLLRHQ